ncbi:MAG: DNA-binding protein [Cellulosilyticum sp.]|nr:DNA-binding protein [Cellulosilyticum sp.]
MKADTTYQENKIKYLEQREKKTMTLKELKEQYGISTLSKAKKIVQLEGFPKLKVGNQILILRSRVDEWFENNIGLEI